MLNYCSPNFQGKRKHEPNSSCPLSSAWWQAGVPVHKQQLPSKLALALRMVFNTELFLVPVFSSSIFFFSGLMNRRPWMKWFGIRCLIWQTKNSTVIVVFKASLFISSLKVAVPCHYETLWIFFFISRNVEFDKGSAQRMINSKRHLVHLNRAFIDHFIIIFFAMIHPLKPSALFQVILARFAFGWAYPLHL